MKKTIAMVTVLLLGVVFWAPVWRYSEAEAMVQEAPAVVVVG